MTSKNSTILNGQSAAQFQVRYFASATDYANNSAIANPDNYPNTNAYQLQNIIAEVSNTANVSCKATTSFNIQVFASPTPAAPTAILPIKICDNTSVGSDADGKVLFDLSQRALTILNGQSGSNFTLSYFKDNAFLMPISNPTNYQNSSPTETIFVKITNNQNSTCVATTSFQIEVLPLPLANATATLKQCDSNNDGFTAFNLNEAKVLLVTNPSAVTFAFFTSDPSLPNPTPINNLATFVNQTVNSQTIYVRITNANGCFRVATINLIISTTNLPPTAQKSFTVCDDTVSGSNTDGIATFNFSSATPQIQNLYPVGQLLTIAYFKNIDDALAEVNPITNTANHTNTGFPNLQTIYVRVDSQVNNECLGIAPLISLVVEPIPIIQNKIIRHCDDNQDGIYSFDTTNLQTTLLSGLTNVSVVYFSQNGTPLPSPLPNSFITASQTLTVKITNTTTAACNYNATLQFIVDALPQAFSVPINLTTVCDNEPEPTQQNGSYPFDGLAIHNALIGTQTGLTINYFDANGAVLPSPLPNIFNSVSQNISVEIINPLNISCPANAVIPLVVNPVPNINLTGDELVCTNDATFIKVIGAGLTDPSTVANFSYAWYKNGILIANANQYSLSVNSQGNYTVVVTNANSCFRTRTIVVNASDAAQITDIEITDLSDNNTIKITANGQGTYVYSIDGTTYQNAPIFTNVDAGIYNVYVKDLYGCGISTKEISILGIPPFFTPNGDGYNDFWNIQGANERLNSTAKVLIFDRFGKLIKQISPTSQGWDGTFNQLPLPSDDYWYAIELENQRVVKGHFALKR